MEEAEEAEHWYHSFLLGSYNEWVCQHDNAFIGPRVGCEPTIDEDSYDYVIDEVE